LNESNDNEEMIDVETESVISKINNSSLIFEDLTTREHSIKTSDGQKRSIDETQIPSRKKNKDDSKK